jgi:hypothetical protein
MSGYGPFFPMDRAHSNTSSRFSVNPKSRKKDKFDFPIFM